MTRRLPLNTALILIDVQDGFDHPSWGRRNNAAAESNIGLLLSAWREDEQPVFHVRHLSLMPRSVFEKNHPGCKIKHIATPLDHEPVISKHVNSAFIGTSLEQKLRDLDVGRLLIVGLTTDHCVSTSVRMAANLGFEVFCAGDATATFERQGPHGKYYSPELIHEVALASLNGEFATIVETAEILAPARPRALRL